MREFHTQVLVIGAGTSGVCAAIQAARAGVQVILMEETAWLGGMLTAAGVSAIDGNHRLPSGLWGEFRQRLYDYYGGPEKLATGWVSHTLFEPHIGHRILQEMVAAEKNIRVYYQYWFKDILKVEETVIGAQFESESRESLRVRADITIDASEYGDVLAAAGCSYRVGREARNETGESFAPDEADDIIQDITYVAILKDYGPGCDKTIPEPAGYDPDQYRNCCRESAADQKDRPADAQRMLDYGRLPNEKYMINWPLNGNDCYLNIIEKTRPDRFQALEAAKQFTLGFIYFIQTELGYRNLGLADDEFPTKDGLALIPYNRESRRLAGVFTLKSQHLENPYHYPVYKNGIAVGDYPLDHHHQKPPRKIDIQYPPIWSFNVPYQTLLPKSVKGLIVAERNISVTHMVNGCTRLQPCVMLIGQAAGMAAALCVKDGLQPFDLPVRKLQQKLIAAGCQLVPFVDVLPGDWGFAEIQRVALSGMIQGERMPAKWVNETRFYPEKEISTELLIAAFNNLGIPTGDLSAFDNPGLHLTGREVLNIIKSFALKLSEKPEFPLDGLSQIHADDLSGQQDRLRDWNPADPFHPAKTMTRRELAVLLDRVFDPFHRLPVDLEKQFRNEPEGG